MRLPNKPSKLILVALQDLKTVIANPNYTVDMEKWHRPKNKTTCLVCLAGAVMAKKANYDNTVVITPALFNSTITKKLFALNFFRVGYVNAGLRQMDISTSMGPFFQNRKICSFHINEERFFMDMTELANDLALEGL